MKTTRIICLVSALGIAVGSYCQAIANEDVPEEVQSAFRAKFPAANNLVWSHKDAVYEGKFMLASEKERVDFDDKGTWIETGIAISEKDLPQKVKTTVIKTNPGCRFSEIEEIQTANANKLYQVECPVKKDGTKYRIAADGKMDKAIALK